MIKNFFLVTIGLLAIAYAGLWYLNTRVYPIEYGISFSHPYATSLGLDWKKTYLAIVNELQPKYLRIGVEWNEVEPEPGKFNFANIDFMLAEAAKNKTKVVLAVGQKVPRWPECYFPAWFANSENKEAAIFNYLTTTVERYKNHPALELWQVENEPYIPFDFGVCHDFNPQLVAQEIELVRKLDSQHKILVTDSGELSTWRKAMNAGDLFGTTLYRTVSGPMGWYFNYDWVPASFYYVKAKLFNRPLTEMFVAELQAEPWFAGTGPLNTPASESEKTMNPERLQKHFDLVKHTGMSRAYVWGAEWWYLMKEKNNDARYWDVAEKNFLVKK